MFVPVMKYGFTKYSTEFIGYNARYYHEISTYIFWIL